MSHDTFTDHDRINWLESQLASLHADHARLVEENRRLAETLGKIILLPHAPTVAGDLQERRDGCAVCLALVALASPEASRKENGGE